MSRCLASGARTPGAWKQHRSDTDELLVHDAVPVEEHPELVTARLNNSSEFQGETNGVAREEPMRPARTVAANILHGRSEVDSQRVFMNWKHRNVRKIGTRNHAGAM
jgi:hypothetical protein